MYLQYTERIIMNGFYNTLIHSISTKTVTILGSIDAEASAFRKILASAHSSWEY